MESTEIFFDTNFLRRKNVDNYSIFQFGTQVEEFIDFLGSNDVLDCYVINVSGITVEELKKQIKDNFEEERTKLKELSKKFQNVYNLSIEIDDNFNYDDFIQERIEEYFKFRNINIVDIGCVSFEKILEKAINKKKPFAGENNNSDKGFKDAVLWESIIEYAKRNKNRKFILLTKNVNDFPKELEREFQTITKKEIEIVNEISIVQEKILLEQEKSIKGILSLQWLSEHKEELLEEINNCLNNSGHWEGFQIMNISRIEDLVNVGNDFYSFSIYNYEDEREWQWHVECSFKKEELNVDSIVPCL